LCKTDFFIIGKYFFDGGGEKRIKPSSSRHHRQGMFCFQQNTPPNIPRPPKPSQSGGFNRLWRFPLRPLCASFPLRGRRYPYQIFIKHFCPFCKRPEQFATPKDILPGGGKTFALRVRVALMNIWIILKISLAQQSILLFWELFWESN